MTTNNEQISTDEQGVFNEKDPLREDVVQSFDKYVRREKIYLITIGLLLMICIGLALLLIIVVVLYNSGTSSPGFEVKVENILKHLDELQKISDIHQSRTARTGYNASGEYVLSKLKKDYFDIKIQDFTVPDYVEIDTPELIVTYKNDTPKQFVYKKDFTSLSFQGSGNVTGNVQLIYNYGCENDDFKDLIPGNIALVQRGNCPFYEKAIRAFEFKAKGCIIYNSPGTTGLFEGTLGELVQIPVFSISYQTGHEWTEILKNSEIIVKMYSNTSVTFHNTFNIIAETKQGKETSIIVVGSHLDGVSNGPGINDNGSGSSTNLEMAIQFQEQNLKPINKVRFAWWGAEEIGLVGSKKYVSSLSKEELSKIAMNLNFDMLASPNYRRGIYNGSSGAENIRHGSTQIQKIFEKNYQDVGLSYDLVEFNGRSDYGPFIEVGIPAGGLEAGAEGIKDSKGRDKFGGIIGLPYDPCYHLACDSRSNINEKALAEMSRNAATALYFFAFHNDLKSYLN